MLTAISSSPLPGPPGWAVLAGHRRASESRLAPARAFLYPLLPFPPRNCIRGSQGGTPPCLRALKITLKKSFNSKNLPTSRTLSPPHPKPAHHFHLTTL